MIVLPCITEITSTSFEDATDVLQDEILQQLASTTVQLQQLANQILHLRRERCWFQVLNFNSLDPWYSFHLVQRTPALPLFEAEAKDAGQ